MGRPRKKYILFLVEGYTDIEVLAESMTSLIENSSLIEEKYEVQFCTIKQGDQSGGDITAKTGVSPDNIEGLIGKLFVDPFLEKNPFIYPKEISEIIQIIDLDGAFIPREKIVGVSLRNKSDGIFYAEDHIETENIVAIQERNERKRDNVRKLVGMNEIIIRPRNGRNTKKVKYSVYYFSCNMDHVIHKKMNLSQREKVQMAVDFSGALDSIDTFIQTIYDGAKDVRNMTYQESWDYIMNDSESLKRHTNLHLLIDRFGQSNRKSFEEKE